MKKIENQKIRQRIKKKRGEVERKRKRKFLYLKHTGQLGNYYMQKILMMKKLKLESVVKGLRWWQRIYIFLVLGFKRLCLKLKK